MAWIWAGMTVFAVIYGAVSGTASAVGEAALEGARSAVELCIGICGATCMWTGLMEILRRAGAIKALSRALRPALGFLYPAERGNTAALEAVSANMAANMLGLGSAATPLGIKAAGAMRHEPGEASDAMCMMIVVNTASIQLIPATVAAVRGAAGSSAPFDILPAVWASSALSVAAGVAAAKIFARIWRRA